MTETQTQTREVTVNRAIERSLKERKQKLTAQLEALEADSGQVDIGRHFFTVSIYDPYDGLGPPYGSCTVTARGLAAAVKHAENTYRSKSGMANIRTDGALKYSVYAELPGGGSVELPLDTWADLTCQPLQSLKKGRK